MKFRYARILNFIDKLSFEIYFFNFNLKKALKYSWNVGDNFLSKGILEMEFVCFVFGYVDKVWPSRNFLVSQKLDFGPLIDSSLPHQRNYRYIVSKGCILVKVLSSNI